MAEESTAVSFFSTKEIECPVCGEEFRVEKLRGKRVNAKDLDDELRRQYIPTEKYGTVRPLIYPVVVCPECYYATLPGDFTKVKKDTISGLSGYTNTRKDYIKKIFDKKLNFKNNRTLDHGAASYILAVSTYSFFPPDFVPTFKRGLCSLRAAWLFNDLVEKNKEESAKYSYIRDTFYLKAAYYYDKAIELEQKGDERLENVSYMGPDTDRDYKYDGVKYISSILNYKLAFLEPNPKLRAQKYAKMKTTMGRLFGFGKSTKEKPGTILEKAKDLYDQIQHSLKELEEQVS